MAHKAHGNMAEAANETTAELMAGTKKQFDQFASAQSEFLGKCQKANRYWLDRIQAEAKLASEFTAKLTAAHSIPDAMSVCQEWTSRRLEMMAEDTTHLLHDAQKFMQSGSKGLGTRT